MMPVPFEQRCREAAASSADDIEGVEALLYACHQDGIEGGRLKLVEAAIEGATGWKPHVIAALSNSEKKRFKGRVLSTPDGLAEAYIAELLVHYVDALFDEGALHVYAELEAEPMSDVNFYSRVSHAELEADVTDFLRGHPLMDRAHARKEVLRLVAVKLARQGFFAGFTPGLNCLNGFATWDAESQALVLLEHAPEHRARFRAPLEFGSAATAPVFLNGIRRVLPDSSRQMALQEFIGAILFGSLPDKENVRRMLVLYGATRSGKSTILDLLQMLFPPSVVTSVPLAEWSSEFARARLAGMYLNVCTELNGGAPSVSAFVKQITAGETVSGRLRFGQTFPFVPFAFHVFATNELPKVQDRSGAIERRALVIEFEHSLSDSEVDGAFREKVREELPGIVAWAAEGFERAMRRGRFTVPTGHKEALVAMQHQGDPVAIFAHLELEKAPGSRLLSADLKAALRTFARHHDYDPVTIGSDGSMRRMSGLIEGLHGGRRSKTNNAPYYEGVRLKAEARPAPQDDDLAGL